MKNSNHNMDSPDQPEKFVLEIKKGIFDKYGDRLGIISWGYDTDKEMWWDKRKSGNLEYYKKMKHFRSWMKVDLAELIQAPFHNPNNDFLEGQVNRGFPDMPTADSFVKKAQGVCDPHTNKTMMNVMWPLTTKVKPFRSPRGYLRVHWTK